MTTLSQTTTIDQAQLSARALERLFERVENRGQRYGTNPYCTPPYCHCSDCSRLSRGVGGYFQQAISLAYLERRKRLMKESGGAEQEVPAEAVPTVILQYLELHERMQTWNPATRELWFVSGNGERTVLISSQRRLKKSYRICKTQLTPDSVETFLEGLEDVDGARLITHIRALLGEYVHFVDSRMYLFLSIWLTGTYLYSLFGHYGYLFSHYSRRNWPWKTRTQELISDLSFEGTGPLNAPTPVLMEAFTFTGLTVPSDRLKSLEGMRLDLFSFARELLGRKLWRGKRVADRVAYKAVEKSDPQGPQSVVFAPYVFAGINEECVDGTVPDCPFPLELKLGPTGENRGRRYRPCMSEAEFKPVRDDLYTWALQNAEMVSLFYELNPFEKEIAKLALSDPAVDIWKPLFTVLFVLGFDVDSAEWSDLSSLAVEMHRF